MKLADLDVKLVFHPVLTNAEVTDCWPDYWVSLAVAEAAATRAIRDALHAAGVEVDG